MTIAAKDAGRALAARLGLKILGIEGHDLKTPCVSCKSSDAGRVHVDKGVFQCYACSKALNAFDLCKVILRDPKAAVETMVSVGLFEDRSNSGNGHVEPRDGGKSAATAATDEEAFLEVCRLKRIPPDALRAYGGKAKHGGAVVPMWGPDLKVCSTIHITPENGKGLYAKGKPTGLFFPKRSPEPGESWCIVEGPKDAAALYSLGFLTAGLPNNRLKADFAPLFKGTHVTLIPDADKPSWKGGKANAELLKGHATDVKVAKLPCEVQDSHGRDIRDVLADGGPAAIHKTIELAEPAETAFAWFGDDNIETRPAATLEPGTRVYAGDRGNIGEIVSDNGDTCIVHFVSPEGQHAEKELPKSQLRSLDGQPVDGDVAEPLPLPCSLRELVLTYPKQRAPVIEGLLRVGETMNIVAAPKKGKSWLGNSLALSVASGSHWLDTFHCVQGRVLCLDAELHPEVIANRLPTVSDAMGLGSEVLDSIDVLPLRGFGADLLRLKPIIESIEPGRYALVILDAWYRFLPQGYSENDNAQVMALYNTIDGYAASLKASWVNIHHASKGDQSGKSTTDVGSGAGSQSRAADTHLVIRQHEQEDVAVIEAVVRSWPPVDRLAIRWNFPIWELANDADPRKLWGTRNARDRQSRENKDIHLDEDRKAIVNAMVAAPDRQTKTDIRDSARVGNPRFGFAWQSLITDGTILSAGNITKGNNRSYESFTLSHQESDQ